MCALREMRRLSCESLNDVRFSFLNYFMFVTFIGREKLNKLSKLSGETCLVNVQIPCNDYALYCVLLLVIKPIRTTVSSGGTYEYNYF